MNDHHLFPQDEPGRPLERLPAGFADHVMAEGRRRRRRRTINRITTAAAWVVVGSALVYAPLRYFRPAQPTQPARPAVAAKTTAPAKPAPIAVPAPLPTPPPAAARPQEARAPLTVPKHEKAQPQQVTPQTAETDGTPATDLPPGVFRLDPKDVPPCNDSGARLAREGVESPKDRPCPKVLRAKGVEKPQ